MTMLADTSEPVDRGARMRRRGTRWGVDLAQRVALLAVIVALWQAAASAAESLYFPPPFSIADRARDLWLSGPSSRLFLTDTAVDDVLPSVVRLLAGWAIGVVIGATLGVVLGLNARLREFVEPTLHFIRSLPPTALVPVFILVLGVGTGMRISLVTFGVVWIVMINAAQAVQAVDSQLLDTAAAYRLSFTRRIGQVVLPAASPPIFAAMRIGLSLSLILGVLTEMLAGFGGIGFQLTQAQNSYQLLDVWATMLLLGVLGVVLNALFSVFEGRALAWHRQSRSDRPV